MSLSVLADVLSFTGHVALALWFGSMIFLGFVTAPALFSGLPRAEAARSMAVIFSAYYRFGTGCGAAIVLAAGLRAVVSGPSALQGSVLVVVSAMLALTLYAWRSLLPRVEQARRRAESADPTEGAFDRTYFKRLHAHSMRINVMIMVLGLLGLWVAWLSG